MGSSNPAGFVQSGDRLFFSAYTPASGRELWSLPLSALLRPYVYMPLVAR
jgi:hypothetical protein